MFEGVLTALVTPFRDGSIDERALQDLVELQISAGVDGLVPCGSTGEAATLSHAEHRRVVEVVVAAARGRVPVLAGTGSNSTSEAIDLTRHAKEAGADAAILISPYYNKPTQEGLYLHYKAIAEAVPIPQILYNVPGRTVCDIMPATVARLARIPNIVGIKEATGNLERARELLKLCPEDFELYSGDDATAMEFMLLGGRGVISVTTNVAPRAMQEMCAAALKGDAETAGAINDKLMGLHKNLFVEANPIPVKWVLEQMGLIEGGIRLPLTRLSEIHHAVLRQAMQSAGLT